MQNRCTSKRTLQEKEMLILIIFLTQINSSSSFKVLSYYMSWQSVRAVLKSMKTYIAWAPRPNMHTTLLSGLDLVPPKFLGLWRIIILLFASAAKITVSISST